MHLDLHVHSTCSDGALAPAAVVAAAGKAGLGMIALADHDTAAGVAPARAASAAAGCGVIAAIEITTRLDAREVHLLGYGFRDDDPGIARLTARAAASRRDRVTAIVERLQAQGVTITEADVRAEPECASIGRLHVARALVRLGRAGSVSDAFGRFIGDGAPSFVPSCGLDVTDAIAVVAAAGGCAVWAHPALDDARHFARLAERGLAGVEALRPSLDPHGSVELEQAARAARLVVTGGSDWHGASRPALGSWFVTEKHVGAFLERLGIGVR